MRREEVARRFYSKLTTLPSIRILVLILAFSIILPGLIVSVINSNPAFILAYILGGLTYIFIFNIMLRNKPPFNLKRILGLATYTLTIGLIIELLAIPSKIHGLLFTSSSGIAYVALASLATSNINALIYVVASSMTSYIVFALASELSFISFLANILVFIIGVIVYTSYLHLINKRGEIWGLQPLKLAKAFLLNWLSNITEPMESILSSLSKPKKAKIRVLVFERKNSKPIALVLPEIHYGPFRNVGSSTMIYMIEEAFNKKGYNVLALHGPGSHEHNLPTAKYAYQISYKIVEEFAKTKPLSLRPRIPNRIISDDWEALTQPFDKAVLAFITRPKGIDDLPPSLLQVVKEKSKTNGMEILLVDSHNSYTREEFNGDEVKGLIDLIIDRALKAKECVLKVGYGEVSIENPNTYGLCTGKVRSLVWECNGRKIGITYLYGNNMFPETRVKLREIVLGSKLLDDYEPITPDDHTCTATLAEHPYVPVKLGDSMLQKAILESINRALRDLGEAKVYYYGFTIDNVRYVGEGIFDMLGLLEEVGGFVEKTINVVFASTMALQLLATYLLSYFI